MAEFTDAAIRAGEFGRTGMVGRTRAARGGLVCVQTKIQTTREDGASDTSDRALILPTLT